MAAATSQGGLCQRCHGRRTRLFEFQSLCRTGGLEIFRLSKTSFLGTDRLMDLYTFGKFYNCLY